MRVLLTISAMVKTRFHILCLVWTVLENIVKMVRMVMKIDPNWVYLKEYLETWRCKELEGGEE